ncbi:hypothetical protein LXL04_029344 [Taraxacum kok-saghyz]
MGSVHQPRMFFFIISTITIVLSESVNRSGAMYHGYVPSPWTHAHATFYGNESASETMGGACGYGNLITNGYGTDTAALSSTIFSDGYACGQCYQIRTHFDMAKPAFMKIAQWKAGIVPIMYRRVPCNAIRKGGIKFSFQGNGYWLLVYVMNVAGAGDIKQMWVKGTKNGWISMSHNWGASYQAFATLKGQALSFRLTSYTTKQTITAYNVAPANWNLGLTYQGNVNFH